MRDPARAAGAPIPGARPVAFASLGAVAHDLPAGRPVVVVDVDEERAAAAAERLHALGVHASWLAGGLPAGTLAAAPPAAAPPVGTRSANTPPAAAPPANAAPTESR